LNNIKDQNMFLILTEDNPPNPPQVIAKISNSYKANMLVEKLHENLPKMIQLSYPISKGELKSLINQATENKVDEKQMELKSIYEIANSQHKHSSDILNIETKKYPEKLLKQLGINLKLQDKKLNQSKIIYPNINVMSEQYNSDDNQAEFTINTENLNFDSNITTNKKVIWETKPHFENRNIPMTKWSKDEIKEITSTIKYHAIKQLYYLKIDILEQSKKENKSKIKKSILEDMDGLDLLLKEFENILKDIDLQINYTKEEIISCTMNNEVQEKKRLITELKLLKEERIEHLDEIDDLYLRTCTIKDQITKVIKDQQLKNLLSINELNDFNEALS
tara:strand:+ start:11010 stop:12014 length:1005 start_codon:yes stop_codon:yes gene_type:complete